MIRLRTLGTLDLRGSDGAELRALLAQPKRLALLAYLAIASPSGFRRRDTLVGLFWPELDHEHARAALRKALHGLRNHLGDGVVQTRGDEEITLAEDKLWCDGRAFERALVEGRRAEALELYRGDLLAGLFISGAPEFERWVERERARFRQQAAAAAGATADEAERRGEDIGALQWGRRALTLSPDDEGAVRRMIALLDRVGDRAGALHVYEEFARQLAADYEAEPAAETQALIEAVRQRVDRISGEFAHRRADLGHSPPKPAAPAVTPPSLPRGWVVGVVAGLFVVLGLAAVQAARWIRGPHAAGVSEAAAGTRNPEAFRHFQQAKYYAARRTADMLALAVREYDAAVRLDSGYGRAIAGLAFSYAMFVVRDWSYPGMSRDTLVARGLATAAWALGQDSTAADAWVARSILLRELHPRTLEGVQEAIRRAAAVEPLSAEVHHEYAAVLRELGDDSAAMREYHRALELDPDRPIELVQLGATAFLDRNYEQARYWEDSALRLDPAYHNAYGWRGYIRLFLEDTAGARSDAETALRLSSGDRLVMETLLTLVEAREGDTAAADARVTRLLRGVDLSRPTPLVGILPALALMADGKDERALDVLERIRPRGAELVMWLRFPLFDALRSQARFQRLLEQSRPVARKGASASSPSFPRTP